MPSTPSRAPLDYDALAEALTALAYPLRLELLDVLEIPHTLSSIRLRPRKHTEGEGSRDRAAAMQTILTHLERLVESALVVIGEANVNGKTLRTYSVNPQRIYALTEELGRLSLRHSGRGKGLDHTGTLSGAPEARRATGPCLVLVHGAYEGRGFPLDAGKARDGAWIIGRAPGLAVSLDYDPFISVENSTIKLHQGRYVLADLPGSKNGTSLNWEPLLRGGSRPLEHGDVIGVGRSLLNFYDARS